MGRKAKFSFEIKMDVVQRCLVGKTTVNHEAVLLSIHPERIREWISLYQSLGEEGLHTTFKKHSVLADTKRKCSTGLPKW